MTLRRVWWNLRFFAYLFAPPMTAKAGFDRLAEELEKDEAGR